MDIAYEGEVANLNTRPLTAAALVSEHEQALAAGMNDFLTKPIDERRLQQALLRWIAPRRGQAPQPPA